VPSVIDFEITSRDMLERNGKKRPSVDVDIITDVSNYAHVYGIKGDLYISPQVLKDIKDIPDGYEERGEIDRSRLNLILSRISRLLDDPHDNVLEFSILLDRKHHEGVDPYPLTAKIEDGYIQVFMRNEKIEKTAALVEEVGRLRSSFYPPTRYRYGNSLLN
jgi:hypothetical protein